MTVLRTQAVTVMRKAFAARSRLTGSQWANRHGWIARSSGAAEPGQYGTERAPYLAEILDVMTDEVHRDVVLNKPAQVGFTELINQFCGYCMAEDPSGLIVVQPSIDMAKAWVKERVDPMLAESPRLRGIVRGEGGRRTSDDTMQRKVFAGGWLVAIGSNSATGLRSRPARRVLGDERSGWTVDAKAQGDPWDLLVERTSTFWNAKRIQGSTPGEEDTCPITAALKASDWREFHVKHPCCGHVAPLEWRAPDGTYRLVCEKDALDTLIPATARYLCLSCGTLIPESEKPAMLRSGRWIPRHPERLIAGFDLNGLVSPWRSWSDIMDLWVRAQHNYEKLKVFVTHVLAQPWKLLAERIDVHTLSSRAEPLEAIPDAVGALVMAIDVQKDRVESLVVGVGVGEELYVLEWAQHEGDPTTAEPWKDAWKHLSTDREGLPVLGVAIDTGYLSDECWKWVEAWHTRQRPVLGTKGVFGRGRPIITTPGRRVRRKERKPWLLGVDTAKDILALRLRQPVPPGGPGAVHFAETLDFAYYEQVTAEEQRPRIVGGRPTKVWVLPAGKANEGLDLLIGCLGVLHHKGAKAVAGIRARPPRTRPDEPADDAPEPVSTTPSPRPAHRRKPWVTRF